jgi:TnpA family transposase
MTWYNLLSDQFTGLNAIPVPGTLRDSLVLLAVVLEQQTELKPTRIMTDTGAYSDVMFGLFRHLGYRFCPRLADIGGTRFWRIDPRADYGKLNVVSQQRLAPAGPGASHRHHAYPAGGRQSDSIGAGHRRIRAH